MERAQSEELVIASYVFEDFTADEDIFVYLDIPAIVREIFKNLFIHLQ